jgi:hypothetical protein
MIALGQGAIFRNVNGVVDRVRNGVRCYGVGPYNAYAPVR